MTIETRQARAPRYRVSLADDGAFLIYDRRKLHGRTARYYPAQFVSGCMSYDDRTARFPDYVHAELWRLHDVRSRARLDAATRAARTTNVTEGLHVTLSGKLVESHVALVEHVTL